jgi:hypothetical protein
MSEQKQEAVFVSGLYLNRVSEKAPEFIITNQDIHVEKLIAWLQENKNLANEKGYIRKIIQKPKVKQHAAEILEAMQEA